VNDDFTERFEILGLAGSGGMGDVHRARERQSGRVVAIKTLAPGGDVERFEREARVLSTIKHPGVVDYLEHGVTSSGLPYLVMEWLGGEDLDALSKRGPMSIADTMTIARGLAEALAAAHRAGIVHRDLKPANIFLVDGDVRRAKILDFGIARPSHDNQLTVPGTVLGTPAYMAPEQVRGDNVDSRADVYALGGLLFRCLAGRPPFGGAHAIAILAKVVMENPPRIAESRNDVPPALDALITRMLSKDPNKRPRDADEVLELLGSIDLTAAPESRTKPAVGKGEHRVACVVLCAATTARDVTLAARQQADQLARVRAAVDEHGGVIDALSGSTWLITIRDPATPNEQATRAARCALALSQLRPNSPIVLAMGRVLVTGDTQVGEVIDRASLEVVARTERGERGSVVDEAAAELLSTRFAIDADGPWHRLRGERTTTTPRTLLGKPAQCIGRAQELSIVAAQLDDSVKNQRVRSILISAAPGLGKSRLVQEILSTTLATRDVDVLMARGDATRAGSPFGVVNQIVSALPGLDGLLAAIAAPSVRDAARTDVAMIADTVRDAFVDWLRARVEEKPTVLVIEDAQWADLPSVRLLDAAADALKQKPLTILATSRLEEATTFRDMLRSRGLQEIQLGPLSKRGAERLVRDALPDATDDQVQAIVARAAGHPFHLEELVRAVAHGQGADALPDTVLGMVQARLDVVGPDARRVLRAGSVLGETFWVSALHDLLGDAAGNLDRDLQTLIDQELIAKKQASRFANETELAFRHALVRDTAYAMLTDADRRVSHRTCGAWLEAHGETDSTVLAEHFERGGVPDRARPHQRRAAERALEGNDLERAAQFAERALAGGAEGSERAALFGIEAEIAFWRGQLDLATERARTAIHDLSSGGREWFSAVAVAIGAFGQRGMNDDVAHWLGWAVIAKTDETTRGAQIATLCRGLLQLDWAHYRGDLADIRAHIEAVDTTNLDPYVAGWVHRARGESAWIHARDVDRSLSELTRACDAFEQARAARALCLTHANRACIAGWSGAIEAALRDADLALVEAERVRSPFLALYAKAVRGLTLAFAGDAAGEAIMREALVGLRASPRLAFVCHMVIGWSRLSAGDGAGAEECARAAIALPVVVDLGAAAPGLLALALLLRGDVDAAGIAAIEGETLQARAADLDLMIGMTDLALAEVARARNDERAAREALSRGFSRVESIARTIGNPEQRAAFLSRSMPNDRLSKLAREFGILTA
jgi:eukaryotic-like serine/threonine-protein kinase